MELCGSRRKLRLFVLFLVYFSGYFNIIAGADICSCQQYSCNPCLSTGSCSKINVALGKPARASSLFDNTHYNEVSGPACLAVNGNTGTEFKPINTNPSNPACVHTADGDYTPYWEVDLGHQYILSNITVYRRNETFRNILRTATISVDDKVCYTFPSGYPQPAKENISCNQPLTGRKVKIQKHNDTGLPFIAVCQVQVWGCNSGFYGTDCTDTCGNCSPDTCEPSSGFCPQGCVAGYQAPYCKLTCNNGSYGPSCNKTCGNCSQGTTCNPVSGECPKGCKAGYQGTYCNKTCNMGLYGPSCNKTCGNCFERRTCNLVSGECPQGCKAGYQGTYCNKTCNSGLYGPNCNKTCGNCFERTTCNPVSGECPHGCRSGYQGTYCNETCYNGSYGLNCSKTCTTCSERTTCNPVSGECPQGCIAGNQGTYCNNTCRNRTYGNACNETCGKCFEDAQCNIVTGHCETGCVAGYYPPLCNIALTCLAAGPDSDHGSGSTAGTVAGAIVGSISGCVIGFLLGMLFLRFRLRQHNATQPSTASFSASMHRVDISSPAEESSPSRPVSADYENVTAAYVTSNVYDSLKVSPNDNVYTKLT